MRRSFLRYTRTFLLPLLALGLVLTGCDSSGSNGNNDDNDSNATSYSESGSYADEVAVNILAFDLGVRTGSNGVSNNSESDLIDLYEGNSLGGQTLPSGLSGSPEQGTYGDIATVNVSSLVSTGDLALSDQLEPADTPSDDGSTINTDELLRYYFGEAGANDVAVTANGIVISQFAEKMLLGTPIYGQGATILSNFADGDVSSNQAEQWDKAFGYFGFPRTLEPFLDYSTGEGLAGGPAQDLDDNGSIDLESEYAYTWAQYAIERSATAETNGQPNDFARRAFEALVQGRKDIENGEDPSDHAQTALDAWEATVAVNVIHYINAMESGLSNLDDDKTIAEGDIDEGAWGEAKAFAWNLQFYSDKLDDLDDVLENIGNDPPYGEMEVSDYEDDLADATETIADAYDFNSSNVENW